MATYAGITAELIELNSRVDTTELDKKLIALGAGKIMEYGSADRQKDFFYKVLEVSNVPSFQVQYTFLDGKELSSYDVDSVRSVISRRLRKGGVRQAGETLFDGWERSQWRRSGWFEEGMMVKEFEEAVKKKTKGMYSTSMSLRRNGIMS